ncbi:hypothetical protein BGZ76_011036 [Entomortierella beljakovae]|nr:hypothetical protein BGZ76_011036 [Entomortierella beljakovae]
MTSLTRFAVLRSFRSATRPRVTSCLKSTRSHAMSQKLLHSSATNALHTKPCLPINLTFPAGIRARTTVIPSIVSKIHTSAVINGDQTPESTQKKPETRLCWKCSTPVPYMAYICSNPQCNVVQTLAPGANYFEILGLSTEPTFDIDVKALRNKFLRIQQQIHPDSYALNENGDHVYAQQQSSLANKAYSTLKEPLSRAIYMLDLLGSPIHETESLNEPELLMEVMEARELLEDAQTEEEVEELKSVNENRMKETEDELTLAFRKRDLETAKSLVIKLQYWVRIRNVIRDWAAGKPVVADHV